MHISDVHDYNPESFKVVEEFIEQGRKKQIKDAIEQLVQDEFDRLEEYANEFISQVAAHRSERFLERVLKGDEDAAMALLGDKSGVDRYRTTGYDSGKPWARLIHGRLFQSGGMELRQRIVKSHVDLLKSERIADLESIVEGLSDQVRKLEMELEDTRRRLA